MNVKCMFIYNVFLNIYIIVRFKMLKFRNNNIFVENSE